MNKSLGKWDLNPGPSDPYPTGNYVAGEMEGTESLAWKEGEAFR